jgi:multidrug efflux pump subunit AcrA (membrane-fusion protein)
LVVREHRPARQALLVLLAVGLTVVLVWVAYAGGQRHARARVAALELQSRELQAQLEHVIEGSGLREEAARLEQASRVDRQAVAEANRALAALEERNAELEEEVRFFRRIMDPQTQQQGLQLQRLRLLAQEDGGYAFWLVLTQAKVNGGFVQGKLDLNIHGTEAGKERILSWDRVVTGADAGRSFRFRHFQILKGRLVLPGGFVPDSVRVAATLGGKKPVKLEKAFPWAVEEAESDVQAQQEAP